MSQENRERDLVLAPNEYAFISDQTKGNINVYVGPYKTSLANTDKPVIFNPATKLFEKCSLDESIQTFTIAPEGWYVVLKNPSADDKQPKNGTSNSLMELKVGRKINIPGPISFALWPGQMAKVLRGHHLRSNQYLVVRVYDEEEARKNWKNAVIKPQSEEDNNIIEEMPNLTMGKLIIIKGMNVSFYIPPTGVEVVPDEEGNYVREAVTLERMEYCILLDENGNKRYVKGPDVVFPEPTEEFIEHNGARKFRAIELNEISGLYIKVIAPYTENGKEYKEGDELFITGKDQMIYYPRPEHAIIKYGNKERHFAIAIPEGEGRYYLNRMTGTVSLKKGPCMFLPDPRTEVLVRRILDPRKVQLWFPGNKEALEYNTMLAEMQKNQTFGYIEQTKLEENLKSASNVIEQTQQSLEQVQLQKKSKQEKVSKEVVSDSFERGTTFTPPRMITLNTKYDGAVTIRLRTGYAILVVSPKGTRKVIVGPQTYLLEYDEDIETIEFSTGTPKTDEVLERTVYLRVLNNKVSDIVKAETSDYCQVGMHLSYRVNFEGDSSKWFEVENYVKFLTDHMRSVIRNVVKKYKVMDFYANGIDIIRDIVLGKPNEQGKRPGRLFEENNMRIYDVEVLNINLGDDGIETLLITNEQDVIKQSLKLEADKRKLEYTKQSETITREIVETQSITRQKALELQKQEIEKQLAVSLANLESNLHIKEKELKAQLDQRSTIESISASELKVLQEKNNADIALKQKEAEVYIKQLEAEVKAVVEKANAISPDLVAALQAFSDKALAEKMAESMAPLAILGGKSVAEVLSNLLKGTIVEKVLSTLPDKLSE